MTMRTTLAGAALLALAACNAPAGNNSSEANAAAPAGNQTVANEAAPAPAGNETAAAPAGSATLSREFIVGRWTETSDCADAMDFRADGSLHAPFGDAGRWELDGDKLINVGNPNQLTVRVIDQNTMETTNGSGRTTRVTRCQA